MNEMTDPDAGKTRAEMIAELDRMKAALARSQADNARHARQIRKLERELREHGGDR